MYTGRFQGGRKTTGLSAFLFYFFANSCCPPDRIFADNLVDGRIALM